MKRYCTEIHNIVRTRQGTSAPNGRMLARWTQGVRCWMSKSPYVWNSAIHGIGPLTWATTSLMARMRFSVWRMRRRLGTGDDGMVRSCGPRVYRMPNESLVRAVVDLIRTACSPSIPPLSL